MQQIAEMRMATGVRVPHNIYKASHNSQVCHKTQKGKRNQKKEKEANKEGYNYTRDLSITLWKSKVRDATENLGQVGEKGSKGKKREMKNWG